MPDFKALILITIAEYEIHHTDGDVFMCDWLAGKVDRSRLLDWRRLRQQVCREQWNINNIYDIVLDYWKVRPS